MPYSHAASGGDTLPRPASSGLHLRTDPARLAQDLLTSEASLHLAEAQFEGAFELAPIGMALLSADDRRFLRVNHALCDLVGYEEARLLSRAEAEITHPSDLDRDAAAIEQVLSGDLPAFAVEKRYLDPDGEVIWVNLTASLVRDGEGRPLHFIAQIQNVSERRRLEAELAHMHDHDPLTGLLNRRGLEGVLQRQIARLRRQGGNGALILVDVDHFKSVNDTLGHGAGDELIVALADLLKARLRSSDAVARLGGDEFAIVLGSCDTAAATKVAETIVAEIRRQSLSLGGHDHQRITASVGVALLEPGLASVEDALVAADLAVYEAKEAGGDRAALRLGSEDNTNSAGSRLAWIQRIRAAIEQDRLTLHLQPILNLRTGQTHQYEVLLRMLDDQGDYISPGLFLPVAERYGLISEIDRWVVRESIRLIAETGQDDEHLALEINLSGKSLGDPSMLVTIEEELTRSGIDPGRLIFEVTETAAVANIQLAREFASRLGAIGCRFALDDFGAGFSSFYYLKHLPCDYLKIDGEFVTRCIANRTDQLVIKALVAIAEGLGKCTIAECVEDQGTLDFLRLNGVDFAQGYHIGRPAPVASYLLDPPAA